MLPCLRTRWPGASPHMVLRRRRLRLPPAIPPVRASLCLLPYRPAILRCDVVSLVRCLVSAAASTSFALAPGSYVVRIPDAQCVLPARRHCCDAVTNAYLRRLFGMAFSRLLATGVQRSCCASPSPCYHCCLLAGLAAYWTTTLLELAALRAAGGGSGAKTAAGGGQPRFPAPASVSLTTATCTTALFRTILPRYPAFLDFGGSCAAAVRSSQYPFIFPVPGVFDAVSADDIASFRRRVFSHVGYVDLPAFIAAAATSYFLQALLGSVVLRGFDDWRAHARRDGTLWR